MHCRITLLLLLVASGCSGTTTPQKAMEPTAQPGPPAQDPPQQKAKPDSPDQPRQPVPKLTKKAAPVPAWPNWRGPNHDGISTETRWTQTWKDKPPVLWETQVGIGYSSVAVKGERLYTLGHKQGQETVFCLNAQTGKKIWSKTYPSELVDNLNDGGPGATPTIDGEFVFTNSRGGEIYCFRAADGEIVWKQDLRTLLHLELPEWGFTCSPLVFKDWIILDANRVIAFDKKTGKKVWVSDEHQPGYATPAVFSHEGEQLLATLNCDGVLIVRVKDGSTIAKYDWGSPFATNSTTPIVRKDTIFISTGYNKGCILLKLAKGKLEPVYENRKMRNHFNNSVLFNGKLYGFDGNNNLGRVVKLVCMDYATGKVDWFQRGFGCGSLLVAGDKLIVLSDEGTLAIAKASPDKFEEIARCQVLDGECWTVPVLLGGLLYCRDSAGHLVCLDLRTPGKAK